MFLEVLCELIVWYWIGRDSAELDISEYHISEYHISKFHTSEFHKSELQISQFHRIDFHQEGIEIVSLLNFVIREDHGSEFHKRSWPRLSTPSSFRDGKYRVVSFRRDGAERREAGLGSGCLKVGGDGTRDELEGRSFESKKDERQKNSFR